MKKKKKRELEYFAGIIDARAGFHARHTEAKHISVRMQGGLPRMLHEEFGGSLTADGRYWRLYGHDAAELLKELLPHLRLRKREAARLIRKWEKEGWG